MKKTLTVAVLVILVLSAFASLSASHVKAQASDVRILSYTWYAAPSNTVSAAYAGDLVGVAEVQNIGSNPLNTIIVYGAAYNSSDYLVCGTDSQLIGVPELLPGQKAPLYLDFNPLDSVTQSQSWVPTVANVTLMVTSALVSNQTLYTGLTIPTSSVSGFDDSGTYTVRGTVENSGDETVGNVWVIATYYNAAGKVVSMNETDFLDPAGYLSPGNSLEFIATPTDNTAQMSSEIENYSLLIESSPYTASSTPTPPPSPTPPSGSPTPSAQPTKGPTQANSLTTYETYGVVAAVVVIVAVLVALTLLRNRRKTDQFEPPPPPPPHPPPPPPPMP